MKLSQVSIQRPVFATVMSLAIILFGVIAFSHLWTRRAFLASTAVASGALPAATA